MDAPAASTGVFASQGSEPEAEDLAALDAAAASAGAAALESGSEALRLGSSAGLPSESIDLGVLHEVGTHVQVQSQGYMSGRKHRQGSRSVRAGFRGRMG